MCDPKKERMSLPTIMARGCLHRRSSRPLKRKIPWKLLNLTPYETVPSLKLTANAPENKPSQQESHLPTINFQGRAVSFREGSLDGKKTIQPIVDNSRLPFGIRFSLVQGLWTADAQMKCGSFLVDHVLINHCTSAFFEQNIMCKFQLPSPPRAKVNPSPDIWGLNE